MQARDIIAVLAGFGSGVVISGAVFAFITAVGLVERIAQKTETTGFVKHYEMAIAAGGIFGALTGVVSFSAALPPIPATAAAIVVSLAIGVFYGVLAMSLAEILNVIPIMTRRLRLEKGMFYFILAIALGKMVGAVLYAVVPGFFEGGG